MLFQPYWLLISCCRKMVFSLQLGLITLSAVTPTDSGNRRALPIIAVFFSYLNSIFLDITRIYNAPSFLFSVNGSFPIWDILRYILFLSIKKSPKINVSGISFIVPLTDKLYPIFITPLLTALTFTEFQSNWILFTLWIMTLTHFTICFSCSFSHANCLSLAVAKMVFSLQLELMTLSAVTPPTVSTIAHYRSLLLSFSYEFLLFPDVFDFYLRRRDILCQRLLCSISLEPINWIQSLYLPVFIQSIYISNQNRRYFVLIIIDFYS